MEALACILNRRSVHRLTEPGPTQAQLETLEACAQSAPDHGRLRPWRMIFISGEDRTRLGTALAAAHRDTPEPPPAAVLARTAAKPLQAPLLITMIFRPVLHSRIPEWEQLASASCAAQNICLAAHALELGAIWRTGPLLQHPRLRSELDVAPGEQLLGWIYLGTPC
ncbi:MAG: nitroreductase [Streptomyces sp.]